MGVHKSRILFEDDHLLIAEKLAQELTVQGAGKSDTLSLLDFLKKDRPNLFAVHRLDFETSGAVVFAKNARTLSAIKDGKFMGWKKNYRTLVMGRITRPRGVITKKLPSRAGGEPVDAYTEYEVIKRFANSTYVDAHIETGRQHQIRRHFAFIGHPLVLDSVYGHEKFNKLFTRELGVRRFFLHAHRLRFPHPVTGREIDVFCPIPKAFEKILTVLGSL